MSDYQEYPNYNFPFKGGCKRTQPFGWSDFAKSTEGRKVYYNKAHEGSDWISWDESANPEVVSVCDGTVIIDNDSYTGRPFASYGCNVIIKQEGTNKAWYYCHLLSNSVTEGQKVKKGDVIGLMGGSGQGRSNAWASHLHLGLAILDSNNTRINQDNGTYGFIDHAEDLKLLNATTQIINTTIMTDPNLQATTILTELQRVDAKFKEPWILGRLTEGTQKFAELLAELYNITKMDGHRDLLVKLRTFYPELFAGEWISARLEMDGRKAFNDLILERLPLIENDTKYKTQIETLRTANLELGKIITAKDVELDGLKKNSTQSESQKIQELNAKIKELDGGVVGLLEQNELKQNKINELQNIIDSMNNDSNVKPNSNVPNPVNIEVKNESSVKDLAKIPLLQKASQTLFQSKTVLTLLLPTLGSFGTAVLNFFKLVSFDLLTASLVVNALFVIATICVICYKKIDQGIIRKGVQDLVEISPEVLAGGKSVLELIKNQK